MKKTFLIFLVICLCVATSACSVNNSNIPEPTTTNDTNSSNIKNTSQKTTKNNDNVIVPSDVDVPLLTIESFKEYEKLLKNQKMPDRFVGYDKISQIGEFYSVVFLSPTYSGDYSSCLYTLIDKSGYELGLYVEIDAEDKNTTANSVTNINSADMRLLSDESKGIYEKSGITYTYVTGKLLSVSWVIDGVTYILCGNSMLFDYPSTNATFTGKLLNLESASATINSAFDVEIK